jgi:sulfur carrier protein ThiS
MLTIKVNGDVKKLNIGCRTFVNLDVLLNILESSPKKVTLNGETVTTAQYAQTIVNSSDALVLS